MIALSGECRRRLLRWSLPEAKTVCVYPGVNNCRPTPDARWIARKSLFIPMGCRVVGSVIRSLDEDALTNLMQSIRLTCSQGDNILFALIGGPEVAMHGKQLAQNLAISHKVIFVDDSRDLAELLPAFDVYLMPGGRGSHPLTISQAMSAGLPVISADVPGVSEMVVDGVTGHIVSGRDPVALASGVIRTLKSAETPEMADAAAERSANMFGAERMIHTIERLYAERMEFRPAGLTHAAIR